MRVGWTQHFNAVCDKKTENNIMTSYSTVNISSSSDLLKWTSKIPYRFYYHYSLIRFRDNIEDGIFTCQSSVHRAYQSL